MNDDKREMNQDDVKAIFNVGVELITSAMAQLNRQVSERMGLPAGDVQNVLAQALIASGLSIYAVQGVSLETALEQVRNFYEVDAARQAIEQKGYDA